MVYATELLNFMYIKIQKVNKLLSRTNDFRPNRLFP